MKQTNRQKFVSWGGRSVTYYWEGSLDFIPFGDVYVWDPYWGWVQVW